MSRRHHPDRQATRAASALEAVSSAEPPLSSERVELDCEPAAHDLQLGETRPTQAQQPARGDDPAAQMQQVNEAWRVLSDPALRRLYDAQLAGVCS